jgi:hypothetical protein
MRWAWFWILLTVLVSGSLPVWAEHEPYHRFTVEGYVKDASGNPIPGQLVTIQVPTTGQFASGETREDGLYRILLHLHDEDLGAPLLIRAGEATFEVEARFDPQDHRTERILRVDFVGDRGAVVEGRAGVNPLTPWLFRGAVALLVVWGTLYVFRRGSEGERETGRKKGKRKKRR